ncbi:SufD family Fe-S cluster assembly protein [Mycoplasma bradburyae]|uniref:SufD family Fe-S cluster assembly protein n=1 Tax=Mycoplasma bradburyae TaxID=2963128 RepID=A0ABT5GBQ0_9MOLU|nr:SufD family Fe-S cluster assembly protein [Mycoplasma bradburyae]MDC4181936.1 SufD family Fe-S cluster assembly protein [Mycoplasma bradburyae]UTS70361.1 SufD family Fe-S cluster assembly protein [Mycoplasma bradburyae]
MDKKYFVLVDSNSSEFNYQIPKNVDSFIHFLDINNSHSNLNINVDLNENSSAKVIISTFGINENNKKYNIKLNHLSNNAKSVYQNYVVATDSSSVSSTITSIIKNNTYHNDTIQEIRGVLLSDDATVKGEPQLIIDDNNVKAKHAMAVGRLNQGHLFYLMSKGVPKSEAIKLILMGYFIKTIGIIDEEEKRKEIIKQIEDLFLKVNYESSIN